jgi:threonine dehydrogenase-like Zn-dependent dehydrogenase
VESLGRDAAGLGLAEGDRVACLGGAGFAELEVVDAASVLPLPRALDGQPCPAEPLACAVNAFQRCDVQAGHRVAVVGVGFLGALLVQLASRAGARVVAVARRRTALDMARRMGAAEAVTFSSAPAAAEAALAANGGAPFDRVVEAVGVQESLDLSSQLVRERGRLIIAGYHQDGSRTVDMQSWNWRGLDVINAHERDPAVYLDGMRRAVEAIAAGALDPAPLYTHRFRLDQLAQAFQAAADRPEGFMKALVIP